MEFIRLFDALEKIANHIELGPHLDDRASLIGSISRVAADRFWQENNPRIEHARGIGYASLLLNKALHDSTAPPQWMMFDEEKRFEVRSETAKERGLEMLTYSTSWGNRRQRNCATHFRNSITQGDGALALEVAHVECDDIVPREKILQFMRLGFDCAELAAFLDSNQIAHDMNPQAAIHSAEVTDVSSASNTQERQRTVLKKSALIAELSHVWPTIQADMQEATRNGLRDAAKVERHGHWHLEGAHDWARMKGKLKRESSAVLPGFWLSTSVTTHKAE